MEAFYIVAFLLVIVLQQLDKYSTNQFYSAIVKDLSAKIVAKSPVEYQDYQAPPPEPEPMPVEDEEAKKWREA